MIDISQVKDYFTQLQGQIVETLSRLDEMAWITDSWQRAEGGGGISRLVEGGEVFERGGVNFSHVK
ncbi:coproporphyrinogen III oxidase, partial [Chitinivorax sp. B]|uniref:coproporphyrinogen III oxidase n=1 Tax=Chitinivorax sp. B TaxID=2502235 RepID=UPI0010F8582B